MEEAIDGDCSQCGSGAQTMFCGQKWCYDCRTDFLMENPARMAAVLEFLKTRGQPTSLGSLNYTIDREVRRYEIRLKKVQLQRARERAEADLRRLGS